MKAAWYEQQGPAREVLRLGELDTPQPAAGEVRVRIAWSGINPSDVKRRAGSNNQAMGFDRVVPGMDGAGVIDAVGSGVAAARIGERVWLHSTAWKRPSGTSAQYAVTPSHRAMVLPPGVPLRVGAALGVPALTAHRAVFGNGPVQGQTLLVTGGAGAVGLYAIQLAIWGGARVLTTISNDNKAEIARTAGAFATINYRTEEVAQRVLALTEGQGVDGVVDVDFGANLATTLAVVKNNGWISTYASMTQPQPALPFYPMMMRNLRLLWVFVYETDALALLQGQAEVNDWLTDPHTSHPPLSVFDLNDIAAAHEAVEAATVGKVLIRVSGED